MGALYRTPPAEKVPRGSSVRYHLNQLGGALGVAVVALIPAATNADRQSIADAVDGFHGGYRFVTVACAIILIATPLLPGRPPVPVAAAADGESGQEEPAVRAG